MSGATPKKYGLIVPKKSKGVAVSSIKKPSVFEESSSDEETPSSSGRSTGRGANSSLWRENKKNALQMETHGSVLKALEDDPTVFEYDSLYDDMQEQKKRADPRLVKKDKTSKYITKLKKVADRRKIEQDIIYERKVQREMEAEGLEYGDKDTFLTSAYRQKLEERKKMEEELKEAAKKEEAQDVRKQVDLSRFHRNLLDRITDPDSGRKEEKEERSRAKSTSSAEAEASRGTEEEVGGKERGEERRESDEHQERDHSGAEEEQVEPAVGLESGAEGRTLVEEGRRDSQSSAPEEESKPEKTEIASTSLFPPKIDKEAMRKVAAAKRANEETLGSARERYLARKKAKLTAPIISDD